MKEEYEDVIYPIIWKKENCFRGECKNASGSHWWSVPFTAAFGLSVECFKCHEFRKLKI